MTRNPRYDVLFEPVQIGPVTAPNRFYQTPHANGMGSMKPNSNAALRGIKAEGGWGVVCAEYTSIHQSSDEAPYAALTLWDDGDTDLLAMICAAIHQHGSLAGVELWHGGAHANNRYTRETVVSTMGGSTKYVQPGQARGMDKRDIKALRDWHRAAALRARAAGFDIVYVYAGHEYLPFQFLSRRFNQRTDEYGGSLTNRVRLLKELIGDTREAVGDRCAVAVRLAIDELEGDNGITSEGEGQEIISMLAELPDLWDVALGGGLGRDSCSSRFSEEGFQEKYVRVVKGITTKPVVSVGRFTSPDTMVGQIKRGVQDFIGAARPSIADPFLPQKIDQGREDEIRECIGCNICRSANNEAVPIRCTQNPTIGEEWRRGWHPEQIPERHADHHILVVGGGPAGLEASLALGRRGYHVTLAEASKVLGGRVNHESALPGLGNWIRVRDYRSQLLGRMPNVDVYLGNLLTSDDVAEFDADQIVIATGSEWRRDGVGSNVELPVSIGKDQPVLTPDDIFSGRSISGPVLIYDDEHYVMGGALAEKLLLAGHEVTLITPSLMVSEWTLMTDEQHFVQSRLLKMGLKTVFARKISSVQTGALRCACIYSGETSVYEFDNLLLVTGRVPRDILFRELETKGFSRPMARVGDCLAPSYIADAVYRGHKFAREYGVQRGLLDPKRERAVFPA